MIIQGIHARVWSAITCNVQRRGGGVGDVIVEVVVWTECKLWNKCDADTFKLTRHRILPEGTSINARLLLRARAFISFSLRFLPLCSLALPFIMHAPTTSAASLHEPKCFPQVLQVSSLQVCLCIARLFEPEQSLIGRSRDPFLSIHFNLSNICSAFLCCCRRAFSLSLSLSLSLSSAFSLRS